MVRALTLRRRKKCCECLKSLPLGTCELVPGILLCSARCLRTHLQCVLSEELTPKWDQVHDEFVDVHESIEDIEQQLQQLTEAVAAFDKRLTAAGF